MELLTKDLKVDVDHIFDQLKNKYQIYAKLPYNSSLLHYEMYVEGVEFDFYVVPTEDGIFFIKEVNSEPSFVLPIWDKEIVYQKIDELFSVIAKKQRIKNAINPPRYFLTKYLSNMSWIVSSSVNKQQLHDFVFSNLCKFYTPREIENKLMLEFTKDKEPRIYIHEEVYDYETVVFRVIDRFFYLEIDLSEKILLKSFDSKNDAISHMKKRAGELMSEKIDKNIEIHEF